MRFALLVLLILAFALVGAQRVDARTAEFRAVPAASPSGPDAAALSEFVDEVRALAEEFQLTPAQQVQVGVILMRAADDLAGRFEPIVLRRAEIDDALQAQPVDTDRIERLAEAQGRAAAELTGLEIDTIIAVRAVLDESQLLLLDELRALIRDRLTEWMGQVGATAERIMMSRTALQRGGPKTGDAMTDAAAAMGLTPEQRAAVRAIVEAAVGEFLGLAADLAANRQALGEVARTTPRDEAAIGAALQARADLFEILVLLRVDVTLQIREVLTDDQLGLIGHLAPVLREQAVGWGGDL
ncbi:periplasmic heavy metal sensor [Wenzhouxiangella sp. XN79A]|uniref:periplasmic heavy metal sensor n=1 Tax=Wenzhouxiangella sp. XN79A TaxID=2724193 RepID=UPI00144A5744|nr:periplasmic heavy metal sensor [Wenzhouxiangella sp. XN79A]NKI34246.1 periplasmic heavy metal sensor [Wenzhouxiangella sp. XN79A]